MCNRARMLGVRKTIPERFVGIELDKDERLLAMGRWRFGAAEYQRGT